MRRYFTKEVSLDEKEAISVIKEHSFLLKKSIDLNVPGMMRLFI